jgi:hypothetical protein
MSEKISAFVITAGKRDPVILRATLAAVRFVDELILVDKSEDCDPANIPAISKEFGCRYAFALSSPTCEGDREYADSLCSHDWRICLDDDEILSRPSEAFIREAIEVKHAAIWQIPIHHHILGRWDSAMRSEWRPALYRRGTIKYSATVHAGRQPLAYQHMLPQDDPVYIEHLSHPNTSAWVEKLNRYTSEPDRLSARMGALTLAEFAKQQIMTQTDPIAGDPYREATGLLMAMYHIVDAIKRWEETQPDGHARFAEVASSYLR